MKTRTQKTPGCILNENLQDIRINHLSNVDRFIVFILFPKMQFTYRMVFPCKSSGTLLTNAYADMIMQRTNEY